MVTCLSKTPSLRSAQCVIYRTKRSLVLNEFFMVIIYLRLKLFKAKYHTVCEDIVVFLIENSHKTKYVAK